MRRTAAWLALLLLLAPSPIRAQEAPQVRLELLAQTPFATPEDPLVLRVGAHNDGGTAFGNLTLTVAVYTAARSRSEYAQAVDVGPPSAVDAATSPLRGQLPPTGSRSFPPIEIDVSEFLSGEGSLHPVTVELRSNDVPLATLRTAVVFMGQQPLVPLNVSLVFVLDVPIRLRPDGTFLDDALERAIGESGHLDTIVSALHDVPVATTLAVSPLLLEQLQRMSGGYRVLEPGGIRDVPPEDPAATRASAFLERIRQVARRPTTEIVALPYASPSVPALVAADLQEDLADQIDRGRATVGGILGVEPSPGMFRPPGSALSEESLVALEAKGVATLLPDAAALPPPPGLTFTAPAAVQVTTPLGSTIGAIAPDPGVEARAESLPDDPRLRALITLGELAAIYFEQPSLPRGVAVVVGEDDAPEPEFLLTLLRGILATSEVRWLRAVEASRLLQTEADPQPRELQETSRSSLSRPFLSQLIDSKESIEDYASMAEQSALIDQLDRQILLAESRYYMDDDGGLAFLGAVRGTVNSEFAKIQLPEGSSITLTSRRGPIPVTLRNDTGYPVDVVVTLRSPLGRLEFLSDPSRTVTLSRPAQLFTFPVRAQTTGRFQVGVEVQTPSRQRIGSSRIVVRSTAYNRIALVITIGAALFLALWWGRRFLPRRRA